MELPGNKTENIEEQFRTYYPHVSILPSPKATAGDKQAAVKTTTTRSPATPKSQATAKPPSSSKNQNNRSPQSVASKSNLSATKTNVTPFQQKTQPTTQNMVTRNAANSKSPAVMKTSAVSTTPVGAKTVAVTKTPVTKSPVVGKPQATPLKPPANPQVGKTTPVRTQNQQLKSPLVKGLPAKSPQVAANLKQQVINFVKTPAKSGTIPISKEEGPDQSNIKILNFSIPTKGFTNQLTIEKVDPQLRLSVAMESPATNFVLQQAEKNGQVVLLKEGSAESTVQSVVIDTSSQAASKSEINASEPVQALQVTQQVTLFRPKGNLFTLDEVKNQITGSSLIKQSAMTNVVSSTTNPSPAPNIVAKIVQPDLKKMQTPGRVQGSPLSPVRQCNRVSQQMKPLLQKPARQYQSTRGQVKKVSPKKEIPDCPASQSTPLPPPPLLPPELAQLANEEEVTTSDESAIQLELTKLVVVLPNNMEKTVTFTGPVPADYTVRDLLTEINDKNILSSKASQIMVITDSNTESVKDVDSTEVAVWENRHVMEPEPGEITGLEPGEIATDAADDTLQSELADMNSDSKDNEDDKPLFRKGLLAVCQFCGYSSIDFNHCQRCNRKLPSTCKSIPTTQIDQKSRKTKPDSLTDESPKRKKSKKRVDEPVCLTISDDEELRNLHDENFHSDSNSQMSSCDKEPVITEEMISEMKQSISGGGVDEDDILQNLSDEDKILLQCRTVRIGSYKVVPKDKVVISPFGIKVTVPTLNSNDETVELKIYHHEIIKVLIHFGRQMPVLFFYTRPAAAAKIRKALKMEDRLTNYYDTTSTDETHKRITFLPDKIDDDCKQRLKIMYSSDPDCNLFAELTGKEANDILVKASPKEVQAFIMKKTPNQQKLQQPKPQPVPQPPPLQQSFTGQNIQTIMVYPPPPEKGGIPINTEDYACLDEDQFLNDVIIDFYLKYVVEKMLSPEDRARTHVFSSFFYKRLTTKPPPKRKSMNPVENDPSATPAMKRHSRVKSWTKNVDLFSKDFIVIPINESSHWYLAIVCFPGLTGPVRFSDNKPLDCPKKKKLNGGVDSKGVLSGKETVTIGSTTITAVKTSQPSPLDIADDGEDRDEADGEDEQMDVPDEDEENKLVPEVEEELEESSQMNTRQKHPKEPIKQPCILIFDSLAGASRARIVATLRDYLRIEYEVKHGKSRDFSGEVMKGSNVRCPQQTNYTDCGLYVLQYVEAFFQWPITDFHIPIKQVLDWFTPHVVNRKRYEIQQLLHKLMEEQGIDIEALNLPILNLRPENPHMDDHEEGEEDEEQICEEEEEEGEMMDDDDEEDDEYTEHDYEGMEGAMVEGMEEYEHEEEDDHDHYLGNDMDHEEHEIDEEDYGVDDEEEEMPEGMEDKELEDIQPHELSGTGKRKDLKNFRIPRLTRKDNSINDNI